MVKKADIPKQVVSTALRLAAERGWRDLTLAEIADEAGVKLADLHHVYSSKGAILDAYVGSNDDAVLATAFKHAEGDSPRDRLFDVLMRRFELLAPDKEGLRAILRAVGCNPVAALCGGQRLARSMAWMLEAAGIGSAGPAGRVRVKGLMLLYASTIPVWLRDDSPDLAGTMAALDRRLARTEGLARTLWGRSGPAEDAAAAPEPSAPPPAPAG